MRGSVDAVLAMVRDRVGSLHDAMDRDDRHIGDEHMLLSVLSRHQVTAEVLAAHGGTYTGVRARLAKAS